MNIKLMVDSTSPVTFPYMTGICAAVNITSTEHVVSYLVRVVTQGLTHRIGEDGDKGFLQGVCWVSLLREAAPSRHNTQLPHII